MRPDCTSSISSSIYDLEVKIEIHCFPLQVINITRCSSRLAGICCGLWLILMGIIAPVSTTISSVSHWMLCGHLAGDLIVSLILHMQSHRSPILSAWDQQVTAVQIGAFFTSIPNCVLGGVTSFLFANVAVSGIKIIVLGELSRRTRSAFSTNTSHSKSTCWAIPKSILPLSLKT